MSTLLDFDIVIHVTHDNYMQRSVSVETIPEGVPTPGEVNDVFASIFSHLHCTNDKGNHE